MTIVNVGVSYRSAPAEVLEKLAVPSTELGGVLARLHAVASIGEVAILSTCNRVEVYAATARAADGAAGPVARAVAALAAARAQIPVPDVLRMARIHVGGAAAEHLFSVACGLDSMALGEDQIVAQIKAAARSAAAAGTAGPAITSLIDAALRVSKRARTQTTISTEGISLARAGLDLAARPPGRPEGPRCGGARDGPHGPAGGPAAPRGRCGAAVRGQPRRGPGRRGGRGGARQAPALPATSRPRSPALTSWSRPPGPPSRCCPSRR